MMSVSWQKRMCMYWIYNLISILFKLFCHQLTTDATSWQLWQNPISHGGMQCFEKSFRSDVKRPLDGDSYLKLFCSSWWLVGMISREIQQDWEAVPVGQSYSLPWWAGRQSFHGNPGWSCHWLWVGLGCVHQRWGLSCGPLQISPPLLW